ncbi:hypothetical protein [Natronoarchaeum sp. GCM10025703]|uniref:DUF7139 domain-containing protein n=1 Tax=Natronoarchaeum sp. GCM10025703 TaxID=3252685 RepID=UPI003A927227
MSSLADVYEGHVGEVGDVRRLYVGTGLFLAGAVLTVLAMLVATTGLAAVFGIEGEFTPNLIGGILAGLGVPAILLGVSTILPASDRLRAASVIGASIAVLGVALFWHAYPTDWAGYNQNLTPYVLGVYFLGIMITLGCLFVGIANFKERNDPGGTVSLEVRTESGETRIVEVDRSSVDSGGLGGVGMLGGTPDGEVETQTNRSETPQKNVTRGAEQSQSADQSGRTPGTYGSSTSSSTRETNDTSGGFGSSGTASDGGSRLRHQFAARRRRSLLGVESLEERRRHVLRKLQALPIRQLLERHAAVLRLQRAGHGRHGRLRRVAAEPLRFERFYHPLPVAPFPEVLSTGATAPERLLLARFR